MPVGGEICILLHHRRHDITPGGVWLRRPGGVFECAGADSAKPRAKGAAKHGGEGKSHCKGNLTAVPAKENLN